MYIFLIFFKKYIDKNTKVLYYSSGGDNMKELIKKEIINCTNKELLQKLIKLYQNL